MRLRLAAVVLLLAGCGSAPSAAFSVCAIDGGARAGAPLTLTAGFGLSGCAAPDAVCSVTVDGGTIYLATAATLCSTGSNPGGVQPIASCAVPALEAGSYDLAPFGRSLVVIADGGGGTSCSNPGF
jgi:hypothetical protein